MSRSHSSKSRLREALTKSLNGCFSGASHSSLMFMYLNKQLVKHYLHPLPLQKNTTMKEIKRKHTCQNLWKGWHGKCAVYPICIHLHSSLLHVRVQGWNTPKIYICKSLMGVGNACQWPDTDLTTMHKHNTIQSWVLYLPLGFALNVWVKLICYFTKFREDLVDYIF